MKGTAQEALRPFPSVFLIESNRKSAGDGSGGSRSKFLQFPFLKVIENQLEMGLEAPGANSFGSLY